MLSYNVLFICNAWMYFYMKPTKMASTRVKFVTKVYAVILVYTDTSASCFMSCYKTGNGELGVEGRGSAVDTTFLWFKSKRMYFNTIKLLFAVLLI
jgi:hypothetical protein